MFECGDKEHCSFPYHEDIIDRAVDDWNPQEHTDDTHSANKDLDTKSDMFQVNHSTVDQMNV